MPNGTENSTTAPFDIPTLAENITCGIAEALFGITGLIVNAISVIVILKNKKLKTPCFILIASHAVFCWFMAFGNVTNGVHFLGVSFGVFSLAQPRWSCFAMYLCFFISVPPSSVLIFLISLDRSLGILMPKTYEKRAFSFAFLFLGITTMIGVLHACVAGLTLPEPKSDSVMCYNLFSPLNPIFVTYHTNFNLCFSLLSVVNYGLVIAIVSCKNYKKAPVHAWSHTVEFSFQLQRQMKLLPMINALMISYCIFGVSPPLLSLILSKIDGGRYLQRAGQYAVVLKASLTCIDFSVLIAKSEEFRASLRKLIAMKAAVQFQS